MTSETQLVSELSRIRKAFHDFQSWGSLPARLLTDLVRDIQHEFHFTDDNSPVPGLDAVFFNTLYENAAAPPNVTQRITLAYKLRWMSTDAFNGLAAGDQRDIRIDVSWGPSQTSGHMFVFQHEHVYALDGPLLPHSHPPSLAFPRVGD